MKPVEEGSFDALAEAYFASAQFKSLAKSTQNNRQTRIERFCRQHGCADVRGFDAECLQRLLDEKADTPHEANSFRKIMGYLLQFAVKPMRWITVNPVRDVEPVTAKTKGHHTWLEREVEQFRAAHPIGTMERVAFELLRNTGQRGVDAIRLEAEGDSIILRQSKTDEDLVLPTLPELREAIAACPSKAAI